MTTQMMHSPALSGNGLLSSAGESHGPGAGMHLPAGPLKAITCQSCSRLYVEGGPISRNAIRIGALDWCSERCHDRWSEAFMGVA